MSAEENYIRLADIPQEVWITVGLVGGVLLSYCLCMRQGYSDNWIGTLPPGPAHLPYIGKILRPRYLSPHLTSPLSRLPAPAGPDDQPDWAAEPAVPGPRRPRQVLCLQDQGRPQPAQGVSPAPGPGQHHRAGPALRPPQSGAGPALLTGVCLPVQQVQPDPHIARPVSQSQLPPSL